MTDKQKSKYTTSKGIPWSDVKIRELKGMVRDGKEAAALLAAMPADVLQSLETDDNLPRYSV